MTRPFRISLLVTAPCSLALGARPQPASEVVAFTHAAVVDPGGPATLRDGTVVTGDRIGEIGVTGQVRIPRGARVVDAPGKYQIPCLWDLLARPRRTSSNGWPSNLATG